MTVSLKSIIGGKQIRPPKVVIYGVGGIGKTTFAAEAPNPIFLFTEEGRGTLDVQGTPLIRSWQELLDYCDALRTEDHNYQTVVVDSLDFAEPMLWQHICDTVPLERGGKAKSIEDYGYGKGYVHAESHATALLSKLDQLRDNRKMAVVVICHSEVSTFRDPEAEAYDRYDLGLQKRLSALVHYWADAVLFASWRTAVVKDVEGFNRQRTRGVGRGERILHTEERPAWRAKNRYGLPPELPLVRGNAWHSFEAALLADQSAATNPTQRNTKKNSKEIN